MNFAYDKIVQGIGWNKNRYLTGGSTAPQGKYFVEEFWNRLIDFPYYFERNNIETNIILLESALKSNDNFVYCYRNLF